MDKTLVKRLITLVILILTIICFGNGIAESYHDSKEPLYFENDGEYYYYLINEHSEAELLQYGVLDLEMTPSIIQIPSYINGYPLRTISPFAFCTTYIGISGKFSYKGEMVSQLILGEGITKFANQAFAFACGIKEIVFPSTVQQIGCGFQFVTAEVAINGINNRFRVEKGFLIDQQNKALIYAAPSSINDGLPNVQIICTDAMDNYTVRNIEIPDTVTFIDSFAFHDMLVVEEIRIPGSVKEIADYAFYSMSIDKLTLQYGIQKIGAYAFCDIGSSFLYQSIITIPESVTWLGYCYYDLVEKTVVLNNQCYFETQEEFLSRT